MKQKDLTPHFVDTPPTEIPVQEHAELALCQAQFFDAAPGYFYTLLRHPDGSYAVTFATGGVLQENL